MTKEEFWSELKWIRSKMPGTWESISDKEMQLGWFKEFFSHVELEDSKAGRLAVLKEEILPKAERFMSRWYHHARLAEGRRREHRQNDAELERQRKIAKSLLEGIDDASAQAYYNCCSCMDTGFVSIWSQQTLAALLRGEAASDIQWTEMTAACSCSKGDKVAKDKKGKVIGQFGTKPYFIPSRIENSKQIAIDFVGKFRRGMHREESSFNEWNNR